MFRYNIFPSSVSCYSHSGGRLASKPSLAMQSKSCSSGNFIPMYSAQPSISSGSGSYYYSNSYYMYSSWSDGQEGQGSFFCRLSFESGLNSLDYYLRRYLAIPSRAFIYVLCFFKQQRNIQLQMGNCSTEPENITIPEEAPIVQTPFVKPEPTSFSIPPEVGEPKDVIANTGLMSKVTKSDNPSYFQESPQLKEIELLKPKTLFTDHLFKSERKAIGDKIILEHLQWKRPAQFLKNQPILFEGEIQQYDLKQGRLENSYFVSAFSVLAHPIQLFKEVLELVMNGNLEISSNGVYMVYLFLDGDWRQIVLDDLLPTVYGQYMFSSYKNQLWIWLIEKALAKVFKSYQNIQRGLMGHFLTALTGAPYEYLNTKSIQLVSPDAAWQFIKTNMSHGYMLSISTQNTDRNAYFELPSTFSYCVLDCQEVYILTTTKKKRERILKLNNPWGRYEWKGRWSEYSDVWSEELRHELDYEKADDSIMWINVEDMLKNFGQVCVCKYNPDYINTSLCLKLKQQCQNELKGIFINASARTQGYLSLVQKDHRQFGKNYKYSMVKLILLQMDKETSKPKSILAQKIDLDYYCTIPIQLNPGLYYLIIDMDWTCSFTRDITINVYADHSVNLKEDLNMPSGQSLFYELAVLDQQSGKALDVYVYPHDQNIRRVTGVFGGYVYYHYFNDSKDNKYLSETVKLGDSKNLTIVGQNSPENFALKLLPGQEKMVKMKISKQGQGEYELKPTIKNQVFEKFTNENLLDMLKKKPTKVRQRDIENEKIEVFVKTFEYSGGVAMLYVNQMSKYSYIQEIVFEISNLQLEGEKLEEDNSYNIELEPHAEKMMSFLIVDPSKSYQFKTKVEYYLGTPQFKF